MPPKFRFTRERIADVAFSLSRRDGIEGVTARALADELASSPKVIFGLFRDMEELKGEVAEKARALYKSYIERGLSGDIPFKGVGEQYIRFAREEPKLFRLLFMREEASVPVLSEVLDLIDNSYDKILASIESAYGLPREAADERYQNLWIYSHGIAVLIVTKVCFISDAEASRRLSEVFKGMLINYKTGGKQ